MNNHTYNNMKPIWKVLAWVFALCGMIATLSAWGSVWFGWNLWNAAPQSLFSDGMATGIFAIFFLVWGKWSKEQ